MVAILFAAAHHILATLTLRVNFGGKKLRWKGLEFRDIGELELAGRAMEDQLLLGP
jgi:hypothetical protein